MPRVVSVVMTALSSFKHNPTPARNETNDSNIIGIFHCARAKMQMSLACLQRQTILIIQCVASISAWQAAERNTTIGAEYAPLSHTGLDFEVATAPPFSKDHSQLVTVYVRKYPDDLKHRRPTKFPILHPIAFVKSLRQIQTSDPKRDSGCCRRVQKLN